MHVSRQFGAVRVQWSGVKRGGLGFPDFGCRDQRTYIRRPIRKRYLFGKEVIIFNVVILLGNPARQLRLINLQVDVQTLFRRAT